MLLFCCGRNLMCVPGKTPSEMWTVRTILLGSGAEPCLPRINPNWRLFAMGLCDRNICKHVTENVCFAGST